MFILKKKQYRLYDFIIIPFRISPFYITFKIIDNILISLLPAAKVLLTTKFIDTAITIFNNQTANHNIYLSLFFLMIIIIVQNFNQYLVAYLDMKITFSMERFFVNSIINKREALEYRHIENNETWELINRTCNNAYGNISQGLNNFINLVGILISIASLLIILSEKVLWAGIAIVIISVPLIYISYKTGIHSYKANIDAEKFKRRAGYYEGVLRSRENIEERTLFGYSDVLNDIWLEKYEIARKINMKTNIKNYLTVKTSGLIMAVLTILISSVLIIPLNGGLITVGLFVSLIAANMEMVETIARQLSGCMKLIAYGKEYMRDLTLFCSLSELHGASELPCKNTIEFESIEFKNVTFRYPDTNRDILKSFTMSIKKNRHYAFVGVNGAGKTTITKLLLQLYNNYDGEILINGKELRNYPPSQIKGLFAAIFQDMARYYIPFKSSIELGDIFEEDIDRLNQCIVDLELNGVLQKLPDGINTWLGKIKENGVDLSGGEWQRIAIARVLYNTAPIRILDEPTAALDPIVESNIYQMFNKLSKGKTTISITHRLGAAKIADEIIVIDDGYVKEQGSHQELIALNGLYASMYNKQKSWYEE